MNVSLDIHCHCFPCCLLDVLHELEFVQNVRATLNQLLLGLKMITIATTNHNLICSRLTTIVST